MSVIQYTAKPKPQARLAGLMSPAGVVSLIEWYFDNNAVPVGSETDPIFSASVASGILSSDITNWNTAFGWGDHSNQNYAQTNVAETITQNWTFGANTVTAGNFIDSSDRWLKKEINYHSAKKISKDLEKVNIVSYKLKDAERTQYGVIAQDLRDVYPELVIRDDNGALGVDYRSLSMIAIAQIQLLTKRIEKLETPWWKKLLNIFK